MGTDETITNTETKMTKTEKIEAVIERVTPFIGMTDFEADRNWKAMREDITYWLSEGDISDSETVESLIADVKSNFKLG